MMGRGGGGEFKKLAKSLDVNLIIFNFPKIVCLSSRVKKGHESLAFAVRVKEGKLQRC